MSIKAKCKCGAQFMAQPELAGKVVRCPTCGQSFQVPKPAAQTPKPTAPRQLTVACGCGKTYPVKPELYGKQVRCQACGRQFVVPTPGKSPSQAPAPAPDPLADPLGMSNPLDGLGDLSNWGAPAVGAGMNMPLGAAPLPTTTYSAVPAKPKRKSSFKVNKKLITVMGASVLVVAAIAGIAVAAFMFLPIGGAYSTPQAVFAAHYRAQQNRDWKTVFDTLTPTSQSQLTGMLAGMLRTFGSFEPSLGELLSKHGVTAAPPPDFSKQNSGDFAKMLAQMQQDMAAAGDSIKDKRAFFLDVMTHMEKLTEGKGGYKDILRKARETPTDAELKDVAIDGDTARGTQVVSVGSRKFDMPVSFRKIDGGWRIEMPGLAGLSATPAASSPVQSVPPATGQTANQNASATQRLPNQTQSQGNDSPAAVFTAHKQAWQSKDWGKVVDTVTPESQGQLVGALVYSTHSVSRIDPQLKPVYERYGVKYEIDKSGGTVVRVQNESGSAAFLSSDLEIKRAANAVQDKRGFFIEVLKQKEYEAERVRGLLYIPEGIVTNLGTDVPLKDIVVDGDKARGIQAITFEGSPMEIQVGFQKVDGKWRLDLSSLRGTFVNGKVAPQAGK